VRQGDCVLLDRSFRRSRGQAILKLLALRGGRLPRDQVLELLWPDLTPRAAANNLHKNLHYLRKALGPVVRLRGEVLWLAPEVVVDADEFRALARRALAGDEAAAARALALYRGDLLPEDLYQDWAAAARQELSALYHELLASRARTLEAGGHLEQAADALRQILAREPADEEAHRALMALYARRGQRQRALHQYQQCREVLLAELGLEPSAETRALHRRILEEPAPTRHRTAPEPSFGRQDELELAARLLQQARAGAGCMLALSGVAGIGKTHLQRRVMDLAASLGGTALYGRSHEMEASLAYQPLREVLEQSLARGGPEAQELLGGSLYLRRVALGGSSEPLSRGTEDLQAELFEEALGFLAALARRRPPLALCLDDLHAADQASLSLLHYLARRLGGLPLLLVAAFRSDHPAPGLADVLASLRREGSCQELVLGPLAPGDTRRMVAALLGGADDQVAARLARAAEGHPFFARELARAWGQGRGGGVPGGVSDLVERRLRRLEPSDRRLLQAAAVLGAQFDYGLLRRLDSQDEEALLDSLERCLQQGLLEEGPEGCRFSHGLVREAVYAGTSRSRRQRLHRQAARALAGLPGADPAATGHHFAHSDEPWAALPHLREAARRAAAVFANAQALELYQQALDLEERQGGSGERAALLEELGDVARRTGDLARSLRCYEEALQLLAGSQDVQGLARVRGKAALAHMVGGRLEPATHLLSATLQSLSDQWPRLVVARTYNLLAHLRWHSARHGEALEAAEKALEAACESGDRGQRARAYEAMALACHSLGDWRRGVQFELSRHALGQEGYDLDEAFDAHL
jgi:DNA-binding SARP family transcriptional activator